MSITWQGFTSFLQQQAAALQAAANAVIDFSTGSVSRAWAQAVNGVALWLQARAIRVLSQTRFATSIGPDADSWGAEWDFDRLPAVASNGTLTLARYSTTLAATVPVGALASTGPGGQQFIVTLNSSNPAYSSSAGPVGGAGGYVMNPGTASVTVPAVAAVAGSAGNVLAGTIVSFVGSIVGIDTVTNPGPFDDGLDAEIDPSYKARFPLYIASLREGTKLSVQNAVSGLQQGVQYTVTENYDYSGAADDGFFYVVVDDGSGEPPSSLLTAAANAIEAIRPIGSRFAVFAPVVVTANVSLALTTAAGYDHATIVGIVGQAIAAYIQNLGLGDGLPYTRLAQVAYDASPGVVDVTAILLNSGTSDIAANPQNTIKPGTIAVA